MTKKRILLYKSFLVLLTYLLLELSCVVAIRAGYIPARLPSFEFVFRSSSYPMVFADINPTWGSWHYPESFRLQKGCLNFEFRINSCGARDREREKKTAANNRVLVLGDSFMEGYGVEAPDRLSNLLEQRTGREFLNFACSDFGPTQEYLAYEHLAKDFDHSTVVIGFFPSNDFVNDDPGYMRIDRYRPYYVPYDSGYRLKYYNDQLSRSSMNRDSFKVKANRPSTIIGRFLRSFTCWYNIIDYIRFRDQANQSAGSASFSYYYNYQPAQLQKLEFILTKFRNAAKGKRIILFSIPEMADFIRHESDRDPPLVKELGRMCRANNIEYLDLIQPMLQKEKNYRKLFLTCDPHWNEYAHEIAADILISRFKL